MPRKTERHLIDFLFPITLFLVFASLALTIILLATNIYQVTATNSFWHDSARISLAYVSEKIHQNEGKEQIFLDQVEGLPVLVIFHPTEAGDYQTYIYAKDQTIRELFIKEGTPVDLSFGREIARVGDFAMEQISDSLLRFTCTDLEGRTHSTLVGLRSN